MGARQFSHPTFFPYGYKFYISAVDLFGGIYWSVLDGATIPSLLPSFDICKKSIFLVLLMCSFMVTILFDSYILIMCSFKITIYSIFIY